MFGNTDVITMTTIKSYTTIEQSRKLAEILPLESADMWWNYYSVTTDFGTPQIIHLNTPWVGSFNWYNEPDNIPCWSLAALISILPRFIEFKGDKYYLRFMKEYVEYANDEVSITSRCLHTTGNDNLVDACYEMIIRLNELKML